MKIQIIKIAEKQIKKGSQAIIAGCTEIPIIDPTNTQAKRAIEEAKNIIY